MKFTTIVATILSMAAFAVAVPIVVPTSSKGNTSPTKAQEDSRTDTTADVEVRQNHGKCVKSEGGGVMEDVNC